MNALEKNTYLSGNFAPIREEVTTLCKDMSGLLPKDLKGHFLRVGPNPQYDPLSPGKYHWFDGDGMIHHLHFDGSKVNYANRWVRTKGFELEQAEGKSIWKGFLSLHELEVHHGMMTKNVANTALVFHADRLLALWEAGSPHLLRLPDLKTLGEETFEGTWTGAFTAHPHLDPKTGEMITFGYNPMGEFAFMHGVFDAAGKLIHKAGVHLKGKSVMIHDCAITPDYTVILDMPVTFSLERAMSGGQAFAWEPENGARIGLLPRFGQNEDVKWFEVKTGFIFHVFNAWQEGDEVILEACRSNQSSVISETDNDKNISLEEETAKPHQYRMNTKTGVCSEKPIDDIAVEFSRINEAYVGQKNHYVYASRFSKNSSAPRFDALVKFDREKNSKQVYVFEQGVFSGEFVFAAKQNAQKEDDGYLLGFVQDENKQQSEFYIIDAQRFSEGPVARIQMPYRVPYGFHGLWIGEK